MTMTNPTETFPRDAPSHEQRSAVAYYVPRGKGLSSQRAAVLRCARDGEYRVVARFTETAAAGYPELGEALKACRSLNATLLVAKLGGRARDRIFAQMLQNANIDVTFCDRPTVRLNAVLANIAEQDRRGKKELEHTRKFQEKLSRSTRPDRLMEAVQQILSEGVRDNVHIAQLLLDRGFAGPDNSPLGIKQVSALQLYLARAGGPS